MEYIAWAILIAAYFFILWPFIVCGNGGDYWQGVGAGFVVTIATVVLVGIVLAILWAVRVVLGLP